MEKESNQTERGVRVQSNYKVLQRPVLVGLSNPNYTPIDQISRT
jgi:hypothetical protein